MSDIITYFNKLKMLEQKFNKLKNNIIVNSKEYFFSKCIELAFQAAKKGTFGVGAILVDDNNQIVSTGRNKVFNNNKNIFQSNKHAEMDCLDNFEKKLNKNNLGFSTSTKNMTLYTNLEPCIMCTGRIITNGVSNIHYMIKDNYGACDIAKKIENNEFPAWTNIMKEKNIQFQFVDVIPELKKIALEIFELTIPYVDNKLKSNEI